MSEMHWGRKPKLLPCKAWYTTTVTKFRGGHFKEFSGFEETLLVGTGPLSWLSGRQDQAAVLAFYKIYLSSKNLQSNQIYLSKSVALCGQIKLLQNSEISQLLPLLQSHMISCRLGIFLWKLHLAFIKSCLLVKNSIVSLC